MFTLFDQERETRLYHERLKKRATEEGREEGLEQGRITTYAETTRNLMVSMDLSAERAMDTLGIPDDQRQAVSELLAS
ncbi:MAG: hypothetical protein IJ087_17015 [Eggerthellaceae bacterium]|nr:hypothetical protein [Eggerthellaceae bacterium]